MVDGIKVSLDMDAWIYEVHFMDEQDVEIQRIIYSIPSFWDALPQLANGTLVNVEQIGKEMILIPFQLYRYISDEIKKCLT